ncbi:branched-chain-amino-acid transaminase [[Clostridium] innocuum]|nr:branched-chain-amino-acid transaminase [[Clostridium] innocuum]
MDNDENRLMWLSGNIIPVKDAMINVLTPTSQFGANVFEGIRCYWNEEEKQLYAFRLNDHYNRLFNSMRLFQMESTFTKKDFENSLFDVVKANNYREDIAVRQTVFVTGYGTWSSKGPVDMFVAPIAKSRRNSLKTQSCCISSWTRINDNNMSPRAKVGANYINSRLGHLEAQENGYDTCIFLNEEGHISEGPGSCLFIIKNNTIITPPLNASVLESITRDTILFLAENILNINTEVRTIDRTELYLCDEAFLCGSAMEVGPISKIDAYSINHGTIGEITKLIHECYIKIVDGRIHVDKTWLTPIYLK